MNAAVKNPKFYSEEERLQLDPTKIPSHIAIIPDGNRRWAKEHLLDLKTGYSQGRETLVDIGIAAKELGVKVLTIYTFSTENWKRPPQEISLYLQFVEESLRQYEEKFLELSARFHIIGTLDSLPQSLIDRITHLQNVTKECSELDLVLAINYGSRNEITRAARKLAEMCLQGKIRPEEITEELFVQSLDTSRWPDPDLLIRTSGERRMSNYLLWQTSYTEIYIEEGSWPDFGSKQLFNAILAFQKRNRRHGGGYA
jgi:undecaprenyl diphosphate synthase